MPQEKSSVPANGYLTILITGISRDLNLSHLLNFEGELGIVADSLRLKKHTTTINNFNIS